MTILLVEDDPDVRETVLETLEDEGYAVVGAPEGGAALEILRAARKMPSLILLDMMMPGMNGPQFREAQLLEPSLASIPVVLLSADAKIEEKAVTLRAAGYLKKPVKLDALLEVAARYTAGVA